VSGSRSMEATVKLFPGFFALGVMVLVYITASANTVTALLRR
jgi:hypothetical protein